MTIKFTKVCYFNRLFVQLTTLFCLVLSACTATVTPSSPPTASPTSTPSPTISPTAMPTATITPTPASITLVNPTPNFLSGGLVIINGMIIDGTGTDPIPDGIVVTEGDRIVRVGSIADVPLPPESEVIDAGGRTIMPGIINAHVHNTAHPVTRDIFLSSGVTTVCDVGGPLNQMAQFAQTRSNRLAARGFRAGPIITAPGSYHTVIAGPGFTYGVTGVDEARAAVANLLDHGADLIKLALEPGTSQNPYPILTLEEVQAIVEEAHAGGVLVHAHVEQASVLDIAVEAGVDVIQHLPHIPEGWTGQPQSLLDGDGGYRIPSDREAQLARMIEQGVSLVPTLDPIDQACRAFFSMPEQQSACINSSLEFVGRFHASGGVVALGNDYGARWPVRTGMPLSEMGLLLQAGLTPMAVIEAGTRIAAQVCGQGDELGTLEAGKLADIIVVDGNPLTNIEAMGHVVLVVRGGEIGFAE